MTAGPAPLILAEAPAVPPRSPETGWGRLRCWACVLVLSGALLGMLAYGTWAAVPAPVAKLYYIHVPVAITTLLSCAAVFLFSIAYLWTRRRGWDDLALASARVAALLCSLLLITGAVWASRAWGVWWSWSPRLTFSLVLWVLYSCYLLVRAALRGDERCGAIAAIYGVIAFLDVPLVYLCVKLLPDIHPQAVQVRAEGRALLLAWMAGLVVFSTALIGFGASQRHHRRSEAKARPGLSRR